MATIPSQKENSSHEQHIMNTHTHTQKTGYYPKPTGIHQHIINTTSIIKEPKFAILILESKAHNKNGYLS